MVDSPFSWSAFVDQPLSGATLYVVATPIGNLADITLRALSVLGGVDAILAEDTRHTARLLERFGIRARLVAVHDHNEATVAARIVARLEDGQSLALVSDAGTPLISDPGLRVVRAARDAGFAVVPVPGPSALVCALSVAGIATDRFVFEGFLPARAASRATRIAALARDERTMVFYEAPHRIVDALAALADGLGPGRDVVVARELTKRFETLHAGVLGDVCAAFAAAPERCRGEMVVVVAGAQAATDADAADAVERALDALLDALPLRQAVAIATRLTGARRNDVYARAVARARADPSDRKRSDAPPDDAGEGS